MGNIYSLRVDFINYTVQRSVNPSALRMRPTYVGRLRDELDTFCDQDQVAMPKRFEPNLNTNSALGTPSLALGAVQLCLGMA